MKINIPEQDNDNLKPSNEEFDNKDNGDNHDFQNPRLVFIERSENGTIKEDSNVSEIFKDVNFNKDLLSTIYEININKEKFLIDKEIGALIGLYKQVAETQEKTLTLELNYKDYIYADQNKLKELLIILLDNSLKYTELKDSIKIKTYKKENRCIIEVIDTGIGISKQDQEHIFERFYRAEKSRAREKGGMGLGLSIAYNIVKLHKGTIKVDNKNIEKGTRMIVKLPIK